MSLPYDIGHDHVHVPDVHMKTYMCVIYVTDMCIMYVTDIKFEYTDMCTFHVTGIVIIYFHTHVSCAPWAQRGAVLGLVHSFLAKLISCFCWCVFLSVGCRCWGQSGRWRVRWRPG